jgi:deferrochelatase/peroxidase EfeB
MPDDHEQPADSGAPVTPEASGAAGASGGSGAAEGSGSVVTGGPTGRPGRRSFLRGALGAGVGAGMTGVALGGAGGYALRASQPTPKAQVAADQAETGRLPAVAFHGPHQAGILAVPQQQTSVIAFNATADGRGELTDLLRALTSRARFLTTGGLPAPVGIGAPPSDSGTLGPGIVPDGLTVTVGVGSTLFDDRYGLTASKPGKLTPMRTFPDDELDPAQCGGDLVVQLSAGHTDTVLHALRDITRHTRGAMQMSWRMDGYTSPARPSGTVPRNHFGFMDGISNPDVTDAATMKRLVWADTNTGNEPSWTAGGSYFVVRLIRMLTEFWDRVSISEQENMIGRRRPSGYPLDANSIHATPNFSLDPSGAAIPLTAHMRLANPRTPPTADSRILRRAYNYDRGIDSVGNLDMGLLFTCFQQDLKRQFEVTQTRLIGEPMVDYITPFGGGYFFALPGVTGERDYLGRALLD